jgi:hypothetical protein
MGLVYGVGINDADYAVQVNETVDGKQRRVWVCPFYSVWVEMIKRGYSKNLKIKRPTYQDVVVCEQWHRFSSFKSWMEQQDWEGKQLDKDLLVKGNKVYSPEACVFVSAMTNTFMLDCGASRGKYKIGVSWCSRDKIFRAQCSNPLLCKSEYLGLFTDENKAHEVWLAKKLEHAYALAAIQTDKRVAKALIDRYENYNGVTNEAE